MTEKIAKPHLRFAGFDDTWEQRKVTELGKIYIGLVTTMTKHYTNEGTLLIRNSDIKDGRFEFGDTPIYLENTFAQENESRMHQIGDVITVHRKPHTMERNINAAVKLYSGDKPLGQIGRAHV